MLLREAAAGGRCIFNLGLCRFPTRSQAQGFHFRTDRTGEQNATVRLRSAVTSSPTSSPGIAWDAYRENSTKMVNAELSNAWRLRWRAGTRTEIFVFPVT